MIKAKSKAAKTTGSRRKAMSSEYQRGLKGKKGRTP